MKKRMLCFVMTMLLMLAASGTVLAAGSDGNNAPNIGDQEPDHSLQIMYAKLQLEMAEIAKQQAMDQMAQIAELQEEQRQVSVFLSTAKQAKEEAVRTSTETEMSSNMSEYMKMNGLSYDTTDDNLLLTSEEWDTVVTLLENHLNELGIRVQQTMLYFQNSMVQYNSYFHGTNTSNQTITSLARGQSMYGDSEVGLAVTGLVVGLVLGCAVTLAVQTLRRKKENV